MKNWYRPMMLGLLVTGLSMTAPTAQASSHREPPGARTQQPVKQDTGMLSYLRTLMGGEAKATPAQNIKVLR